LLSNEPDNVRISDHAGKSNRHINQILNSRRGVVDPVERAKNRSESKVWAKRLASQKRGVEYAIRVSKRVFGFPKLRYREPKKNTHRCL
jgi:hypothetical protein